MKKKSLVLSLLALLLVLSVTIAPSLAYFTASDRADGAVPLTLGSTTEIREEVVDLTKNVTIENTDGDPVWIRAIAYVGQTFTLEVSGSGWSGTGPRDWWYYGAPVAKGETTTALSVSVVDIPHSDEFVIPSFNVSVQYESIPVLYDADGNPIPPSASDWEHPLDVSTTNSNP